MTAEQIDSLVEQIREHWTVQQLLDAVPNKHLFELDVIIGDTVRKVLSDKEWERSEIQASLYR